MPMTFQQAGDWFREYQRLVDELRPILKPYRARAADPDQGIPKSLVAWSSSGSERKPPDPYGELADALKKCAKGLPEDRSEFARWCKDQADAIEKGGRAAADALAGALDRFLPEELALREIEWIQDRAAAFPTSSVRNNCDRFGGEARRETERLLAEADEKAEAYDVLIQLLSAGHRAANAGGPLAHIVDTIREQTAGRSVFVRTPSWAVLLDEVREHAETGAELLKRVESLTPGADLADQLRAILGNKKLKLSRPVRILLSNAFSQAELASGRRSANPATILADLRRKGATLRDPLAALDEIERRARVGADLAALLADLATPKPSLTYRPSFQFGLRLRADLDALGLLDRPGREPVRKWLETDDKLKDFLANVATERLEDRTGGRRLRPDEEEHISGKIAAELRDAVQDAVGAICNDLVGMNQFKSLGRDQTRRCRQAREDDLKRRVTEEVIQERSHVMDCPHCRPHAILPAWLGGGGDIAEFAFAWLVGPVKEKKAGGDQQYAGYLEKLYRRDIGYLTWRPPRDYVRGTLLKAVLAEGRRPEEGTKGLGHVWEGEILYLTADCNGQGHASKEERVKALFLLLHGLENGLEPGLETGIFDLRVTAWCDRCGRLPVWDSRVMVKLEPSLLRDRDKIWRIVADQAGKELTDLGLSNVKVTQKKGYLADCPCPGHLQTPKEGALIVLPRGWDEPLPPGHQKPYLHIWCDQCDDAAIRDALLQRGWNDEDLVFQDPNFDQQIGLDRVPDDIFEQVLDEVALHVVRRTRLGDYNPMQL